jgi:MarR family transcriptional regulator, organic hydroperoxide resistance regulator
LKQENNALAERFDKSLFVLLHNLGPQLINRAHLGLTPGQVFMLHYIKDENQYSVSKLAEKMEVAPSAITVMVDRLENHGFVNRLRDKSDRRVVKIKLTNSGEEKLKQVLQLRKQIVEHCLLQLDPNEMVTFIHTLESLASVASALDLDAILNRSAK